VTILLFHKFCHGLLERLQMVINAEEDCISKRSCCNVLNCVIPAPSCSRPVCKPSSALIVRVGSSFLGLAIDEPEFKAHLQYSSF